MKQTHSVGLFYTLASCATHLLEGEAHPQLRNSESVIYHTFYCHSPHMMVWVLRVDYSGISAAIAGRYLIGKELLIFLKSTFSNFPCILVRSILANSLRIFMFHSRFSWSCMLVLSIFPFKSLSIFSVRSL